MCTLPHQERGSLLILSINVLKPRTIYFRNKFKILIYKSKQIQLQVYNREGITISPKIAKYWRIKHHLFHFSEFLKFLKIIFQSGKFFLFGCKTRLRHSQTSCNLFQLFYKFRNLKVSGLAFLFKVFLKNFHLHSRAMGTSMPSPSKNWPRFVLETKDSIYYLLSSLLFKPDNSFFQPFFIINKSSFSFFWCTQLWSARVQFILDLL